MNGAYLFPLLATSALALGYLLMYKLPPRRLQLVDCLLIVQSMLCGAAIISAVYHLGLVK